MILIRLYLFLSIETYSGFCFVTSQEGRIFALGGCQVVNGRGQNKVSVLVRTAGLALKFYG